MYARHNDTDQKGNDDLRLIDYFSSDDAAGIRCGEHMDYRTFPVAYQHCAIGGLEFDS